VSFEKANTDLPVDLFYRELGTGGDYSSAGDINTERPSRVF
jgi:hypothetical protein